MGKVRSGADGVDGKADDGPAIEGAAALGAAIRAKVLPILEGVAVVADAAMPPVQSVMDTLRVLSDRYDPPLQGFIAAINGGRAPVQLLGGTSRASVLRAIGGTPEAISAAEGGRSREERLAARNRMVAMRTARELREILEVAKAASADSAGVHTIREQHERLLALRDLGGAEGLRALREQQTFARSLGIVRAAQVYAPSRPTVAPAPTPPVIAPSPAPAPQDARALKKERAAVAASQRGAELRALPPDKLLSKLRRLKGVRKFAAVAHDHGMSAAELHALEASVKPSAAPRKHRRKHP